MPAVQLATRIDKKVKDSLEKLCERRGLKMNRFIEEAILDKLEELEDIEDLKKLRREKFRSLDEVLSELKTDGKI
jgi:predicted DNA-binding protein